jgi:hypothetical protein
MDRGLPVDILDPYVAASANVAASVLDDEYRNVEGERVVVGDCVS